MSWRWGEGQTALSIPRGTWHEVLKLRTTQAQRFGTCLAALSLFLSSPAAAQDNLYRGHVDEYEDDVFQLEGGVIVEKISYGYVGYIGYRKEAVLWLQGSTPKLWVEDKDVYTVEVLRYPAGSSNAKGELVTIEKISSSGDVIRLLDGRTFNPGIDAIVSTLWLPGTQALLVDGELLINLSDGEAVEVYPW